MGKKLNFAKKGKRGREGLTLRLLGYGFCRVVGRDFRVCSAIFAGISSGVGSRSSLEEDAGTGVGYCWYVIVAGYGLLFSLDELELR
ncbi:hypothetical protein H5410_019743 [Solanum commersonii]|uniref:Uncharacterized protein n=1 Tax=Solanum commersonii TaxID=4109 RepID=A0A9J5ZC37_SOLCO|nr:hypothetical protein H5410_019743 [Solanum commersonii]